MAELKDLFVGSNMKYELKELFETIEQCMRVEDIIITKKNVSFTFKGYISNFDIMKLQKALGIDSFIVRTHNYDRNEIVFTYNSELDRE